MKINKTKLHNQLKARAIEYQEKRNIINILKIAMNYGDFFHSYLRLNKLSHTVFQLSYP